MGKVEQNHGDYFLKIQDIFWDRAMHFLKRKIMCKKQQQKQLKWAVKICSYKLFCCLRGTNGSQVHQKK